MTALFLQSASFDVEWTNQIAPVATLSVCGNYVPENSAGH